MKNFALCSVLALLFGSQWPAALAAEAEEAPATFSLQFSGLKWAHSQSEETGEDKVKATSLMTGDLVDASVWASFGKLNVYLYPFLDGNALASISYMVRDDWEVGIDLGLNSTKVKDPTHEFSSDLFGAFTTWYMPFENFTLENLAVLDFTAMKLTELNSVTNEEETSKETGTYMRISSNLVVPLAKNVWYLAGVWFAAESGKDHSADTTRKSSQFGLTLAGLRMTVD